ncbi:peroxisomal membrane anchor protein conserved region-domain-containing protein [Pisolithus orientalis]|uniref:peroxisomal membrane anchor protein conserved region-domain-containing protein n=1 Tax=Pisolithus orientalis TaxID=936130 RepID=UPI002224D4DE|nr:peroxisomal membrane anchor protein conserved region-domain-containing protein [Pisolithus orientalis]KAI6005306.1 peroxisomal membrane anchor protein conserved region-domain-containing protein [Pisolithus orientalis]
MTTPDRQDLISNAVAFLSDFSTQQAPLAQRVQFLEAKGLTSPEIEEALKQAANKTPPLQPSPQTHSHSVLYGPSPYNALQPQPWDWRDYFITAVISGTVVYGAVSLFKKHLAPHLKPPTATAYEQDRDELTAQFDAAEALLKEIQDETASVRAAVEEQREKVDKATKDVESVVVEMREGEARTRDEMREIRDEVENIREMLPKMIENNKEAQKQSLSELQQELKSLKTLLLSRSGTLSNRRIPSWQLVGAAPTPSSEPAGGSRTGTFTPPIQSNGKGKDLEIPVDHAS